jgi:hypothetical protein
MPYRILEVQTPNLSVVKPIKFELFEGTSQLSKLGKLTL